MVNAQGAYGDGPCVLAGINAIDERDGERVVLEIVVRSGPDSSWEDQLDGHPWFRQFRNLVFGIMGPGSTGTIGPDGRISFAIPRAEIENYVRAIRQAAQEADAAYQASLAQQREQAQREAEAEPAKRARLAQDQARIDAVLHGEAE